MEWVLPTMGQVDAERHLRGSHAPSPLRKPRSAGSRRWSSQWTGRHCAGGYGPPGSLAPGPPATPHPSRHARCRPLRCQQGPVFLVNPTTRSPRDRRDVGPVGETGPGQGPGCRRGTVPTPGPPLAAGGPAGERGRDVYVPAIPRATVSPTRSPDRPHDERRHPGRGEAPGPPGSPEKRSTCWGFPVVRNYHMGTFTPKVSHSSKFYPHAQTPRCLPEDQEA